MPVISASIRQYGNKPTDIPETYTEPRYCLEITFAPFQVIYVFSHDDVIPLLPPGASYTKARIAAGPMPNINRNAGFISGKSAISAPVYNIVDVDNELTDLFADKNINGVGTLNAKIKEWEFSLDTVEFYNQIPKFTGLIQNHEKPYNTIKLQTADINRGLDVEIFDPLKWKLYSGINATQATIPTTLPVTQIADYKRSLLRTIGDLAKPGESGGYIFIDDTEEIIWWSDFVDVNGIATFTGCEREMLGTEKQSVDVNIATKEDDKPNITEWIVIDEPVLELIKALISGEFTDGRVMPEGWSANQGDEWIEHVSFAAHANSFRVQFQNPGKVKCRDFIEKELLALMNAVLVVDGNGQLNYTPRTMPVDENSGELTLDPSNCVTTNQMTLRHVKDNIYPSIKISFDHHAIEDKFLSSVTYKDEESASHNKVDVAKTKEYKFKGLHAGIHTSKQLTKLAAAYGDDHFYENVEFTVESFVNNIPLGSLVNTSFPAVRDDTASSGVDSPLNRTMLVVAANENRINRTTTYSLVGSLYVQSARQASQLQNNIEATEYRRDKIDISTLSGINISNGIATGSCTLQMGEKYYYVDEGNPGLGLEFSATLNVTINGFGPNIELWVFGPFVNKTTIDLTARSNHIGGLGETAGSEAKSGNQGYCLSTVSGWGADVRQRYFQYLSDSEPVYTKLGIDVQHLRLGKTTRGRFPKAPEPILSSNNGVITGIPADTGGTGGSGGVLSWFVDEGLRPLSPQGSTTPQPQSVYINGSQGGRAGGGLTIVSWGGGNSGNGVIKLTGGAAASVNQAVLTTYFTLNGSRGCGGGPGSLLWIVDGNHAPPYLDNTNIEAYYGDGSSSGTALDKAYYEPGGPSVTYKSFKEPQDWTTNHAESVVRITYLPPPETVKARQLSSVAEFFANQRDGKVKLYVDDAAPTNANLGDAWITQAQLDSNNATPVFSILTSGGWRPFSWETDSYAGLYGGLITMYRTYGTNVWITQDTRPTAFEDGWAWTNSLTGETWILYNSGNDILVQVGDSPVGLNHYRDGNFSLQQEAIARGIGGPWNIVDTFSIPELVEGGTVTPPTGDGTAPPPQAVVVTVNSPTQATVYITPPADDSLVVTYQIYRNGSAWQEVLKTSLFWTDSPLTPSTTYTYEVTSKDAAGDESVKVGTSPPTVTTPAVGNPDPAITNVVFTGGWVNGTDGGPVYTLDPVTNLTVDIYSSSSGELFWTPPGTAQSSYKIEVRRNNELKITLEDASTTNSYYFQDMEPDTFYTWAVRVVSAGERSDDVEVSDTSNASGGGGGGDPVYDLDPPTIRNGGVGIYSSSSAELFWNPPGDVGVGTGYEIYQDGVLRDTRALPTYDPAVTNSYYMDSGLSSGITYTWWVRLVNTGGSERSEDLVIIGTMN